MVKNSNVEIAVFSREGRRADRGTHASCLRRLAARARRRVFRQRVRIAGCGEDWDFDPTPPRSGSVNERDIH